MVEANELNSSSGVAKREAYALFVSFGRFVLYAYHSVVRLVPFRLPKFPCWKSLSAEHRRSRTIKSNTECLQSKSDGCPSEKKKSKKPNYKSCEMPLSEEDTSDSSSDFNDVRDAIPEERKKISSPNREKAGSSKEPSALVATEGTETSEEDGHDGNDDEERASIREEIKNMSFEEIQELKSKLGMKLYNSVMTKGKNTKTAAAAAAAIPKRANKNRPREVSAKKPVSSLRNVFDVKKKVTRDPRFDDLSGDFSETVFAQTYKFLDDMRTKEKDALQKELADEPDQERKQKIKYLLKRIANQENAKRREEQARKKKEALGKQLIERAKQGKKPYFLKKSDERKLSLKEKYEEMKRTEKLDKYLERKRKRNASQDKRHLPKHHVHK